MTNRVQKNSSQPPKTANSVKTRLQRWTWATMLVFFGVFCITTMGVTLLWDFNPNGVNRQAAGEVALSDYLAPKSYTYISTVKTQQLQDEEAKRPINNVYRRDSEIINKQRESLQTILTRLNNARTGAQTEREKLFRDARLDTAQGELLLNLSDSQWQQVEQEVYTAFSIAMSRDLGPGDAPGAVASLRNAVFAPYTLSASFAALNETLRDLSVSLVTPYVRTNMVLDEEATTRKKDEARQRVRDVQVDVAKGSAVVRQGDILTPLQVEIMRELSGGRTDGSNLQVVLGTLGILTILVVALMAYAGLQVPQIFREPRMLVFVATLLLVSTFGLRLLVAEPVKGSLLPYLLPLAAVSMVTTALLDLHLGIFTGGLLALLAGFVSGSPELIAVYLAGSVAGALLIRKAERTMVFATAGFAVAVSQFMTGFFATLFAQRLTEINLPTFIFYNALNGLFSASLAFFCFSVLGRLFGVATVLQLMELSHPSHPLLRRLIQEAPGTYHHSVMVGNLAEQAAERLADNALLARVGSYYHDVGKLARPTFFIDNQNGMSNIHDTLDPCESARIIRSHVTEGVALAKKHRLPRRVTDIIEQHHGTCVIHYFYQKALKNGLDVDELDFRYPGPKPQTKVAAIVMLADGCEAAVRANVQSGRILTGAGSPIAGVQQATDPAKKHLSIEEVVGKIFDDRLKDNQLSDCDLTLRDLDVIRATFIQVLTGIYHPRIAYPDKDPKPAEVAPTVVTATVREITTELVPLSSGTATVVQTAPLSLSDTSGAADSGSETSTPEALPPRRIMSRLDKSDN
jgi:cyclic-di-AMP phosphodiesterase PgpH